MTDRNAIVENQEVRSPAEFGAPERFGPAEVSYNSDGEVLRIHYPDVNETETRRYFDGRIYRKFYVGAKLVDEVVDYD